MFTRKLLVITIVCLYSLLAQSVLYAQNNESKTVTISVSATVNATIELFTIQTFDFRSQDIELSILSIDPIVNPSAGKMLARGTPNSEIRINYLQTRELVHTQTNQVLFFEYIVAGNNVDEQENSELLSQEARDFSFNEDGEFYIWVGGRVDLSTAQPGSYEGEFNLEIEYI